MEEVIAVGRIGEQVKTISEIQAPGFEVRSTFPENLENEAHFLRLCTDKQAKNIQKCVDNLWDGTENGYNKATGSSVSAAIVTGCLALLREQFPLDDNRELTKKLLSTPPIGEARTKESSKEMLERKLFSLKTKNSLIMHENEGCITKKR